MYDGILLCGARDGFAGRNIVGYRLRSAAKKFGYNILVLDSATAMTPDELESILATVITNRTLMIGISTSWLDRLKNGVSNSINWVNSDFFNKLKSKYRNLNIVAGGTGVLALTGSQDIYAAADWHLVGFSDDSFVRLLMLLDKQPNHGLKYMPDARGTKTVDSNKFHQIAYPDDIETELEEDDNFLSYQPIPLEVSRGCIFRCAFCNHPFQGVKDADKYMRTPESLARELKRNYELFKTTRYTIMDDTFNDSIEKLDRLERAIEMAKIPNFEFVAYIKPELLVTKPEMIKQLTSMGLTGGFAGIESFNNVARKAINKGMNIDRVLASITELVSLNPNIKMHAGIILGLTGDTIDDIYQWYDRLVTNQKELFRSWKFSPLGIFSYSDIDEDSATLSPIEKDPAKYGYEITKFDGRYAHWKNKDMTVHDAVRISNELEAKSLDVMMPAGWTVASAWHLGDSNDAINNTTLKKLNLELRGRDYVRQRAIDTIKKFT
jgi:hypothetical protein